MSVKIFSDATVAHHANANRAGAAGYPSSLRQHFSLRASGDAMREIETWHGYQPTPLAPLDEVAARFGVGAIYYKDESTRFNLGSFKALGGAYAVLRLLQQKIFDALGEQPSSRELEAKKFRDHTAAVTVVTATDGNHGRSVAWGARRFGCRCRVYIHAGVSDRREQAMRELGADVVRVAGNYDDSVRTAARDAGEHGWFVVSDTSYLNYTELPAAVMAGYGVMVAEAAAQWPATPTHVFVQGGVGGLAASVAAFLWERLGAQRPRLVVVEPALADCLFQSAVNGCATEVVIVHESVMAGLSCGEVSQLAWQVLSVAADDFLTVADDLVAPVMVMLARQKIEGGESAVAGLAGCLAACMQPSLAAALNLNAQSRVLVFGTEGATDRAIYDAIIAGDADI